MRKFMVCRCRNIASSCTLIIHVKVHFENYKKNIRCWGCSGAYAEVYGVYAYACIYACMCICIGGFIGYLHTRGTHHCPPCRAGLQPLMLQSTLLCSGDTCCRHLAVKVAPRPQVHHRLKQPPGWREVLLHKVKTAASLTPGEKRWDREGLLSPYV